MTTIITKYLSSPSWLHRHSTLALLACTLLLNACGTPAPKKPETTPPATAETPQQHPDATLIHSEFYPQFADAEQKLGQFNWMAAETILAALPSRQVSIEDERHKAYLQARILYLRGDQRGALQILDSLINTGRSAQSTRRALTFQRYIQSMSGNYSSSAYIANRLLQQTSDTTEANSLKRLLWHDLQRLSPTELQNATGLSDESQWQGWIKLAQITRTNTGAAEQRLALQQWRDQNPLHRAAIKLPGGLDYLLKNSNAQDKVTLILPLSGRLAPAAHAVREGYLASYYASQNTFSVEILNVLAYDSVTDAYIDAVERGSSFVIGPLSKRNVKELGNILNRTVPILALNRIDGTFPVGDTALAQLSLAPEDEAIQIANLAFGQGERKALIIRPAGQWGNKMDAALRKQWEFLGGTVNASALYSNRDDYSNAMSAALSLPASEQRAREVRRMLATNVELTSRRRQDIDVVFLLSKSGAEARSLKPLLAFHYAANLPVYATSNVYRGIADVRDKDLNGIHLIETPWLLGENPDARTTITAGGTGSDNYTRLNALGADAFLLQTNFTRLEAGEDMLIRGNTGLLSLTPQLHIQRELGTATFDGGVLRSQ